MILPCGCPDQYPDWDGRDIDLAGQGVHILPIAALAHMPISYELYRAKQQQEFEKLGLKERWPGFTLTHTGMFGGKIMRLLESTDSPSRRVQVLPAPYKLRGRLHRGDVGTIKTAVQRTQAELLDAGHMPKELYLCYLTCPQCADKRGGDRILLLRRWVESPALARKVAQMRK